MPRCSCSYLRSLWKMFQKQGENEMSQVSINQNFEMKIKIVSSQVDALASCSSERDRWKNNWMCSSLITFISTIPVILLSNFISWYSCKYVILSYSYSTLTLPLNLHFLISNLYMVSCVKIGFHDQHHQEWMIGAIWEQSILSCRKYCCCYHVNSPGNISDYFSWNNI